MAAGSLQALRAAYRSGWALDAGFYADPAVFDQDMAVIFARNWQFAGHDCEIPQAGDWFTHAIGRDSVIVARGRDGRVRAFHNVCRHRGARICAQERGRAPAFVCPYHAWAYDLTGKLMRDTTAEHGVASSELGLRPVAMRQVGGLIFVSLAEQPPDFAAAEAVLAPALRPQGVARAKIATTAEYLVQANWKVIWENNRECFHCPTTHPEYIRANYDIQLNDPRHEAEIAARTDACAADWKRKGLEVPSLQSDMTGAWYRANRTPLRPGWASESLDGAQVAPLMGEYPDAEVGTLRTTVFPSFWMHGSCDHAVSTRVTPVGPDQTKVKVYWLVAGHAQEGRDYRLDRIMPFWQRTSEQDWTICEAVQKGVQSRGYVPGPLAKVKERNVAQFLDWYVGQLAA
ncbi:MAG: aromatic ring-hydroxylating dioxygenase subunit alpha [Alphaproteobacteria bacterium]|nr:aromatic ring-hydroxylating dioxygenase subunit alpha [Alphaproteobacteria bacterium]